MKLLTCPALRALTPLQSQARNTNRHKKLSRLSLAKGGYIQVRLNHHHAMGSALHPIILEISAASLSFDPQTSARAVCNYKAFTTPVATILHAEMTRNNNNEVYLNLKISDVKNPK